MHLRRYWREEKYLKYHLCTHLILMRDLPDHLKNCLAGNMHQLIFEVLRMSFEEAGAGYCTEINIVLYVKRGYIPDGNGVWYQEKTLE